MSWEPSGWSQPSQWKSAKLTRSQREEIQRRYAEGDTAPALAVEFGVSVATVKVYVGPRRAW